MKERKSSQEFPQELWNLFDKFVHGEMDRRTFFSKAQKFAIGSSIAALWESLRPNYAWAIQVDPNDSRIISETVTVESPLGNDKISGTLVRPSALKTVALPTVLVIHENRGLNPYIEDVARRLAVQGFIAFAPDGLTSVGGYPGDEDKARELFQTVDQEKMTLDFEAAARWLKSRSDSSGYLGAVGFCFGGGIANILAVRLEEDLEAAVVYYGRQPPATDVPKIRAALLVHDAALDSNILQGWPAYEAALQASSVNYTHHLYEAVQHGFHNDTTPRYDEAAAKLSWTRTLAFFNEYLKSSDEANLAIQNQAELSL